MLHSITFLFFDNLGVSSDGHEQEQPSSLHSLRKDSTDGESFTKCIHRHAPCSLMWTFACVSEITMPLPVRISSILLECRRVYDSQKIIQHVQWSATVDNARSSFGIYRWPCRSILRLCRDVTSEEVCFVDTAVMSFYLEEPFVKFVCFTPCKLFLLLTPLFGPLVNKWNIEVSCVTVWLTFRNGICSLNSALFKRWRENLKLIFSDGSFRLSVRIPFIGVVDCKSFPELIIEQWIVIFTIATDTSPLSDSFVFGGLVDRFFLCGGSNGQFFPISHLSFLKYLQCGGCW